MCDDNGSYSVLSDQAILKYIDEGEIIIEPFNLKHLNTSSYDITLGEYYFREHRTPLTETDMSFDRYRIKNGETNHTSRIYNIYSEQAIKNLWGEPMQAKSYKFYKDQGIILENINEDEKIIFIDPQESIICHTEEFIGGRTRVTTMMKTRSSMGRSFIETSRDASWGDAGFYTRWAYEITNNSVHHTIPLVCGRRIAQIIFLDTGREDNNITYNKVGKYQNGTDIKEIKENWNPYQLLPKLYCDYEINNSLNYLM